MDHRADIYAFGVMAYEMMAGAPPFTGRTPQATAGGAPRGAPRAGDESPARPAARARGAHHALPQEARVRPAADRGRADERARHAHHAERGNGAGVRPDGAGAARGRFERRDGPALGGRDRCGRGGGRTRDMDLELASGPTVPPARARATERRPPRRRTAGPRAASRGHPTRPQVAPRPRSWRGTAAETRPATPEHRPRLRGRARGRRLRSAARGDRHRRGAARPPARRGAERSAAGGGPWGGRRRAGARRQRGGAGGLAREGAQGPRGRGRAVGGDRHVAERSGGARRGAGGAAARGGRAGAALAGCRRRWAGRRASAAERATGTRHGPAGARATGRPVAP